MENKNFWNDENVKEAISVLAKKFAYPNEHNDVWEGVEKEIAKFKKQKEEALKQSSIPLDYEIQCFTDGKFNYWRQKDGTFHSQPFDSIRESYFLDHPKTYPIHSVKRKSDSCVFNVGDTLINLGLFSNETHKINSISIINETIAFSYGCGGEIIICHAVKSTPKPIPLFTTNDLTDIFFMDKFYAVTDDWEVLFSNATQKINYADRTFSTEKKANYFVLMNKPCLSVQDLKNNFNSHHFGEGEYQLERLKELAKSKIK